MERAKSILKTMFCMHWGWSLLLTVLGAAGLIWVFAFSNEASPVSYICYVLSFYALVTDCTSLLPALIRRSKNLQEAQRLKSETEKETDFRRSLRRSLVFKLTYAVVSLGLGALNGSVWLQSMGLYYLVLAVIRAVLGGYEAQIQSLQDRTARYRLGWIGFQVCGILLLVLHLTTTGLVFQIIRYGTSGAKGEIAVIASAAYTFYQTIAAILGVIRYRKNPSPIWGASRNIDLTEAWMSVFFLQASMLVVFEGSVRFSRLMNSLTGGAVCVMAVFGAVGMIAHGHKRKRQKGAKDHGE